MPKKTTNKSTGDQETPDEEHFIDLITNAIDSDRLQEIINRRFIMPAIEQVTLKYENVIAQKDEQIRLMEENLAETKTETDQLKNKMTDLDRKITELKLENDELEQYSRRECLVIHGINEAQEDKPEDEVVNLITKHKLGIKRDDISRTHRLGQRRDDESRPIIVKFSTYKKRSEFLSIRSKLRETQIYVNESLTKRRSSLFYKCRQLVKREGNNITKAWTRDGNIYILRGDRTIPIKRESDLPNA